MPITFKPKNVSNLPAGITRQQKGLSFSKGLAGPGVGKEGFLKTQRSNKQLFNFYSYTAPIGTQSTLIVGAGEKAFLLLQNQGSSDIFLGFGVQPESSGVNAVKIPSDGALSFTDEIVPANEIYAVSGATDQLLAVLTGIPI